MTDILLLLNAAGISVAFLVIMAVNRHAFDYLWLIIHGVIVAIAALAYHFEWEGAGYLLAGITLVFVIAPIVLTILARRAMRRQKREAGVRLFTMATLLHPSLTWRLKAAVEQAITEPTVAGQCASLDRIIARFPESRTTTARLIRHRLLNDWNGILAHGASTPTAQQDPFQRMLTIRALGETGRLNEMVEALLADASTLASAQVLNQTLLGVVQLTGRTHALPFLMVQPEIRAFSDEQLQWMENATHLSAGDLQARDHLQQQINTTEDPDKKRLGQIWLDTPRADPTIALRPELGAALDEFISRRMTRAADIHGKHQRLTPVTFTLIGANVLIFAFELYRGNPESGEMLAKLGGMWPPLVMAGAWWRLGSALFLHVNLAHLAFNMLMLLSLGRSYERRNGSWPMAVLYGLGGLLSMGAVLMLMWWVYVPFAVLAGASGAIFALFGGQTVDMIWRWRRSGMKDDRNALITVALCLGLQAAFDNLATAVSFSAHVSGFVAGLAIGVIFNILRR